MKLFYNGKIFAEFGTNRSMTVEEALTFCGYSVDDPADMEAAYNAGEPWAYYSDDGNFYADIENITMQY